MREYYSEKEKNIIEYLVSVSNTMITLHQILIRYMDAIAIELFKDGTFAIVTNENVKSLIKDNVASFSNAERSILEILILIDYLVDNRMLIPLRYTKGSLFENINEFRIYDKNRYTYYPKIEDDNIQHNDFKTFMDRVSSNKYGRHLPDGAIGFGCDSRIKSQVYISEFIKRHSSSTFFVSPLLVELMNNKFQTPEQIRFKDQMKDAATKHNEAMDKANRQIKIGWGAFTVSVIAILVAVIVPRCTKTSLAEKEEIIEAIESTKIEIPESINSVITNDNLEVSITNEQLDVNIKNRHFNATITNDTLNVKTINR